MKNLNVKQLPIHAFAGMDEHAPMFIKNDNQTVSRLLNKIQTNSDELRQQQELVNLTSHELKTPASSIKLVLNILEEQAPKDNDYVRNLIRLADMQVNRLVGLINNMPVTTLSVEELNNKTIVFNLGELIANCVAIFALQSPGYTITVEGNTDIEIFADPTRIEQVVVNLLANAIKYSPYKHEITITVEADADDVKVSVTDQGIGISDQYITRVFDLYFRAHKFDERFTGSGLGLYICKQAIAQHNGKIGINSQVNKGSTFWFTLPLNDAMM